VLPPHIVIAHFFNKHGFTLGSFGRNLNQSKPKKIFAIIILFATIGLGGVVAATSIAINSGSAISLGAGYTTATTCDANVTLKAKTALDASSGQLYVAAIELSDISQNANTGCGNKTMEMALKINGQMTYASWDIPASNTDSTFNFSAATISLSDYNAMTALTPFQADGLTNIAIGKIGSFGSNNIFNWQARGSALKWMGIASSDDGTKLVATDFGANANGGYIYTSTDSGVTWTPRGITRNWNAIASSSDGTKLVAADYPDFNHDEPDRGYIWTSSDSGETWVERKGAGSKWWQSITSSSDGRKLAAVAWGDYIYTSTNYGATWVQRTSDVAREWQSIASSSDGTKLVATDRGIGPTGFGYIYTSTDSGISWTTNSNSSGAQNWRSVTSSADGKTLAAVVYPRNGAGAGGYIYTSTDYGVTWTQTSAGQKWWQCITSSSDGTKLAAGEWYGKIWTSTDSGVTWTVQNSSEQLIWVAITSSADGSKLAAVDNGWGDAEYWELPGGYIYTGVSGKTRSNN
jgi:hypothetical protein